MDKNPMLEKSLFNANVAATYIYHLPPLTTQRKR